MTPLIQELKEKAEKATPGPWTTRRWNDDAHIVELNDSTGWKKDYPECYIAKTGGWGYSGNADFISASNPSTILKLIKSLEIAENALQDARFDLAQDCSLVTLDMSIKEALEQIKKELSE